MDFNQFAFWALTGLLGAGALGIWTMAFAVIDMKEKLASILTRLEYHEIQIEKHDTRISKLETA